MTKQDLIDLGKILKAKEPDENISNLSKTLKLRGIVCTDETSDLWEYTPSGSYKQKVGGRSISPVLYKFISSELLEINKFPYKISAKDFSSYDSFEDEQDNIELVPPNQEFYLNSKEMVNLISKREYEGICFSDKGKCYLNVRFTKGKEVPTWLLCCETEPNTECLYIDGTNKGKGIKEEFKQYFPQLEERLDKIVKNQVKENAEIEQMLKGVSNLDNDSANLAAYFRNILG